MPHRHALALVVLTAACGAPPSSRTVGNVTPEPPEAAEVAIDPAQPLGALALPAYATRPDEAPFWVAITADAAAVVVVEAEQPSASSSPLASGTRYAAIPAVGPAAVELVSAPRTTIGYGCDQTTLHVVPLTGAVLKPGLVWVLPSPVPAGWAPASLPLQIAEDARERRVVRAGPVAITSTRKDKTHATLRIAVGDRPVHDEEVEAYMMSGADPIDLDMTQGHRPGIPTPEAVFAFGANGPYLVVLDRSGYEGVAFETLLVQEGRARAIESLGLGAYYCAF